MNDQHNTWANCIWIFATLLSITSEADSSCRIDYVTQQVAQQQYHYDYNYQYVDEVVSATATCSYTALYNPMHYEISPSYDYSKRWNKNARTAYSVSVTSSYFTKYQSNIFQFSESATLENIELIDCNVNQIEVGSFESLKTLKELTFKGNNISVLYNGTFDGLRSLEKLSLPRNNISELGEGIFDDLMSLKLLNISHNVVSVVNEDIFLHLVALERLDLSWNRITSVENTLKISSLKSLYLNHNAIAQVTNATFMSLKLLEDLSLRTNNISDIPPNLFTNLGVLTKLDLSKNRLKVINSTSLTGLKSLKMLNLSNNDILYISSHAYYNTPKLEVLSLSNNSLVDVGGLNYIKSLRSIDFDGNFFKCTSLLRTIYDLEERKVVVHKGNNFEEININGIACSDLGEDKAECTDGDRNAILEEYLVRSDERVENMLRGHFAKLENKFLIKISELGENIETFENYSLQKVKEVERITVPTSIEFKPVETARAESLINQDEVLEVNIKQLNQLSSIFVLLLVLLIGFLVVVVLLVTRRFFTTAKPNYSDNLTQMEDIAQTC